MGQISKTGCQRHVSRRTILELQFVSPHHHLIDTLQPIVFSETCQIHTLSSLSHRTPVLPTPLLGFSANGCSDDASHKVVFGCLWYFYMAIYVLRGRPVVSLFLEFRSESKPQRGQPTFLNHQFEHSSATKFQESIEAIHTVDF